jgi:hypothetical protein
VTASGGEPQNLDDGVTQDVKPQAVEQQDGEQQDVSMDWNPPENEPSDGPLHAWSTNSSANPKFLGMQSVELKTLGNTFKTATLVFHGSDLAKPSSSRMEIKQFRRVLGGFDFDNPEFKFYLENDQIQVLKAFLEGQFLGDGYYVRTASKAIAQSGLEISQ